jgi:hypothetical protein
MIVEGWVEILHCFDCPAVQPIWVFSADTDMATQGLISAGDMNGKVLVLSQDSELLGAEKLRHAVFKRVESKIPDAAGLSFAEFRKHYSPPKVIYNCPWCARGEMASAKSMSSKEFITEGGMVECRGDVEIREGN